MKVSLILATKGRVEEVHRFIRSLAHQDYSDLELIVVDQNEDDRLVELLAQAKAHIPIIHVRSESGLSRARNAGMSLSSGDIISFPDDDCWYPDGLLVRVVSDFHECNSIDGLTGRSEDGNGKPSGGKFSRAEGRVDMHSVWKRGISYTIFLRSTVCARVGAFDEQLGVGAQTPFGSGEETDYLIRTIKSGFNIRYLPDLVVFHPTSTSYNKNQCSKAFRYGVGMGKVLSKHRYAFLFNVYTVLRPVGGALLSLVLFRKRKASYHFAIARGRICGLCS